MAVSIARIPYNAVLSPRFSVLLSVFPPTSAFFLIPDSLIRRYFAISDGSHNDRLGKATVSARATNVSHR